MSWGWLEIAHWITVPELPSTQDDNGDEFVIRGAGPGAGPGTVTELSPTLMSDLSYGKGKFGNCPRTPPYCFRVTESSRDICPIRMPSNAVKHTMRCQCERKCTHGRMQKIPKDKERKFQYKERPLGTNVEA